MWTLKRWDDTAKKTFVGKTIVGARYMTKAEAEREGWNGRPLVLILDDDDGTMIFPSRDDEGNGPGALFGSDKDGSFNFPVMR